MNKNYRKHTASGLLLFIFCIVMAAGCSSKSTSVSIQDGFEHIVTGNTNGYYFDVYTSASKYSPRNGVIALQNYDDEMFFQIENVGQKRQLGVQFFIDCKMTSIIVDGVEYETFTIDADEKMSETYSFRLAEPLDTSMNHSMLAILVAGADVYTSEVEFGRTDDYSLALDHVLVFGEDLPMAQTDYNYEQTELVTEFQSTGLLLNTDIENNSRVVPDRELIVNQGEQFSLQYQVGGFKDCDEAAIIITVGLKQAEINNQDFILCKFKDDELVHGVATLNAPVEAGSYEIMGWVVKKPFDMDKGEQYPLDAAYRFTLTVK